MTFISSVEKIELIKKLKAYTPDGDLVRRIMDDMDISQEEFNKRSKGLYREDEFLLMLILADVYSEIEGADEQLSKIYNTHTSDLKVTFKKGVGKGQRYYIEVKHTDKEEYKISKGNLQKRIDYAKDNGLSLLFAISIKGFWMLFSEDYLQKRNGKITVKDFKASKLDDYLDCCSYMFLEGTEIKSVYDKEAGNENLGIYYKEYGSLISYELLFRGKRIFKLHSKNNPKYIFTFVLEALQDRLSLDKQVIEQKGSRTIIREIQTEQSQFISEAFFELAFIPHMLKGRTREEALSEYLNNYIDDCSKRHNISPALIRGVMLSLYELGLVMYCCINWEIYDLSEILTNEPSE